MTVETRDGVIHLVGVCPAQDAEALAEILVKHRSSLVDASRCTSAHGAVLQALIAFRPSITRLPSDEPTRKLFSQLRDIDG